MNLSFGSVCSGIEAPSVAWPDWEAKWFAEIEKFPKAVLAHRYPDVPDLGDFTTQEFMNYARPNPVDVFIGGTPCQGFSVAGQRRGMDDDRSGLARTFIEVCRQTQPTWVVWENVPGCLSTDGGRDFGAFIGALVQLGYGICYRILDAQHFGVPQRRRRVFLVGHSGGSWRPPFAVLFERESLQGDTTPSRKTRERTASCFVTSPDGTGKRSETSPTVDGRAKDGPRRNQGGVIVTHRMNLLGLKEGAEKTEVAGRQAASHGDLDPRQTQESLLVSQQPNLCPPLQEGRPDTDGLNKDSAPYVMCFNWQSGGDCRQNPQEERTDALHQSQTPAVTIPINSMAAQGRPSDEGRMGSGIGKDGEPMNTLSSAHHHAVAVIKTSDTSANGSNHQEDIAYTIDTANGQAGQPAPAQMRVRRLTPKECERLMGFPDSFTRIPYRNKPASACPDGPRYKALGNSIAVPVLAWIGQRLEKVHRLMKGGIT